jgi:hypothetical protein
MGGFVFRKKSLCRLGIAEIAFADEQGELLEKK